MIVLEILRNDTFHYARTPHCGQTISVMRKALAPEVRGIKTYRMQMSPYTAEELRRQGQAGSFNGELSKEVFPSFVVRIMDNYGTRGHNIARGDDHIEVIAKPSTIV